ncbi:MAG TPA: GNAT family N-acetyltransferase [Anaerolineae bacterium]|nr:GNAT family N-acetyltransferase [Anaerolineae bacterium]
MSNMIEDTTSDKLLAALNSNMVAYWSAYGRTAGSTLHSTDRVVWIYTGVQIPLFNGVFFARLSPADVQPTFADLQSRIAERGAPALWWIGPQSKPDNIGSLLEQLGAQQAGEVPGMAIDLAEMDDRLEMLAGFTIEKAVGAERQALWARVAGAGTGFPDAASEALAQLESRLSDAQYAAQRRYIGYLNGTPVATSTLVLESGVAGIYAVATIPEARRKGIGRIMTVVPLLEAKQMGYRVGILQASSMGYPIYKKIGFKDVCMYWLYLQT